MIFLFFQEHLTVSNSLDPDQGAQWLSGRVLDSRLRGCGFKPHRRHCLCAGWSEPLLVAHTTLLEISCYSSYVVGTQKNGLNETVLLSAQNTCLN